MYLHHLNGLTFQRGHKMRKKVAQLLLMLAALAGAFYLPAARADCSTCCAGLSPEEFRACMNECKASPPPVCAGSYPPQ